MAKKKEVSKEIQELKKELEEGRVVIGTKAVRKRLRKGLISKVYLSSNCPEKDKEELNAYARRGKVLVVVLGINNEELGALCKKYYFISVLGTVKKNKS